MDVIAYKSGVSKEEGSRLAGERYLELRRKVFAIQDQEFFVARRDKTSSLAQMAELYNRINAGGKQVETEERAFATLVGLQPTNGAICRRDSGQSSPPSTLRDEAARGGMRC